MPVEFSKPVDPATHRPLPLPSQQPSSGSAANGSINNTSTSVSPVNSPAPDKGSIERLSQQTSATASFVSTPMSSTPTVAGQSQPPAYYSNSVPRHESTGSVSPEDPETVNSKSQQTTNSLGPGNRNPTNDASKDASRNASLVNGGESTSDATSSGVTGTSAFNSTGTTNISANTTSADVSADTVAVNSHAAATENLKSGTSPQHQQEENAGQEKQLQQQTAADSKPSGSATPTSSASSSATSDGKTVCQNCGTTTTPLWRRDENGQVLCNACGLFLKLHGRKRPISLKTDVIKSRNRSRNPPVSIKRLKTSQHGSIHAPQSGGSPSFPALSPRIAAHGSPVKTPLSAPQTATSYNDLHTIEQIRLSAAANSVQQSANGGSNEARQPVTGSRVVSTPSSVFSYPSSPVLAPQHQGILHHHHQHQQGTTKTLPSISAATSNPVYSNGGSPNILPPPSRLLSSAHNSPSFGATGTGSVPSFASLNAVASHMSYNGSQQQQNHHHHHHHHHEQHQAPLMSGHGVNGGMANGGSVNGAKSSTANSTKAMTPHILTPQSRPQSPQATAVSTGLGPSPAINRGAGYQQAPSHALLGSASPHITATSSALRGAMSEQLRPRSPDSSLDRIPPLKHVAAPESARASSLTPTSHSPSASGAGGFEYELRTLKTRISELEIVNDLYHSKVSQLEFSESSARRAEATIRESELLLRKQVDELQREVSQLKQQLLKSHVGEDKTISPAQKMTTYAQ